MNCSGCVLMMSSCHSWRSFQVRSTAGISIVVSLLGYFHSDYYTCIVVYSTSVVVVVVYLSDCR